MKWKGVLVCGVILAAGVYFSSFYLPGPTEVRDDFENGFRRTWWFERSQPDAARIVPDPVNPSNHVAGFFLRRNDPTVRKGKRVEMKLGCVRLGDPYSYKFSAFLPAEYTMEESLENICQWHDMPDFLLGEGFRNPPLKLTIQNGRWVFHYRWSDAKVNRYRWEEGTRSEARLIDLGPVVTGQWLTWEFRIRWASDSTGHLEILHNGQSVYRQDGPTSYRDWRGPYYKMGMYKPDWSVAPEKSGVHERHIYYDNVEIRRLTAP
jgi:hypothetical protein